MGRVDQHVLEMGCVCARAQEAVHEECHVKKPLLGSVDFRAREQVTQTSKEASGASYLTSQSLCLLYKEIDGRLKGYARKEHYG